VATRIKIVPVVPFEDGVAAGKALAGKLGGATEKLLAHETVAETLGAMSRKELHAYVMDRLQTEPDYSRYPELEDIYPERVDYLRGLAEGAGVRLEEAAAYDYVKFRVEIESWHRSLQPPSRGTGGGCSGIVMVGPDGVLGGQAQDSLPPEPKPAGRRFRTPPPHGKWMANRPVTPRELVLRRPRTGYIESWGVCNERGVAAVAGASCSTFMDEPIEDTWPIGRVPLLRFARDIEHLAELYRRYSLHNWNRSSSVWADSGGNAMVVEKSFRRIGIRMLQGHALWCTEGYFHDPEMHAFQESRRREYMRRAGLHDGSGDAQYFADCRVRFARIGELCHENWGRGLEHMNRILTSHAPFPRAVCRHGGPDTAPYDRTVTMAMSLTDVTHNRSFGREWVPWKRFPCQVPWRVTQFPPHP